MPEIDKFEAALMAKLEKGGVEKVDLRRISSSIVGLKNQGLLIDQINIAGQPGHSRAIINGIVDPGFWKKFEPGNVLFKKFEVFPYGIVNPEGYKFKGVIESY